METIWLQRPSADIPWGFRLQGGREFAEPLSVQRVTPGSVAADGICPGDLILKIGNVNATNITHNEAQDVITGASNILQLTIKKGSVVSSPVSPTVSAPQYSSLPPAHDQPSSPYEQHDKYQTLPDYKVGSGYHGYSHVNNSDGHNAYAQGNSPSDPYSMRQFEQAPNISGYSTLPTKSSANRQNSESFRPVPQQNQNKYPFKSTTGIQLQINPQTQNVARDDYQRSYNNNVNNSQSQPMSPVQFVNGDSPYQRQTSEQHGGESQMPDKVLNTMLKNQGTQKPFSYVPTGTDLKEFKERARQRRQPRPVMPRGYTGPVMDDDDTQAEAQQAQTSKPKPGAMPNPDSGMYKHAQYNSPLRMYTSDNAKEQFNIQSGGNVDVTGVNSTPDRRPSDIKDSEVYKMCQAADAKGKECHVSDLSESDADASNVPVTNAKDGIPIGAQNEQEDRVFSPPPGAPRGQGLSFRVLQWLTDTVDDEQTESTESYKPKKPRDPLLRHNSEDDEMRFSGLHTKADIPSKAFHRLNKNAASDNRPNVAARGTDQDEENEEPQRIGNYDEASIRYRGNHIPSPSFRLLQSLAKEDDLMNKSGSPQSSEGEGSGGPRIKMIGRANSPKVAPKPSGDRPVNSPVPQQQPAPITEF